MAEESKQSGLANGKLESGRFGDGISLDDSLPDLEELLDFDIYPDDIPLIAEENVDLTQEIEDASIQGVPHFTDPSSGSSEPIPFNLKSLQKEDSDDYPELETGPFSEDDLDNILLKDEPSTDYEEDGPIALSSDELDNITSENDDYSTNYEDSFEASLASNRGKSPISVDDSFDADELNDTYDTELDDENITLGSDELDHILNADEDEEVAENEFEAKSFFDKDTEPDDEEGPIALSLDELNNITDTDYSSESNFETEDFIPDQPENLFDETSSDEEEIALSGDELNNLLESGAEDDEEFAEGEAKSFFDSVDEEEEIALSPDELSNITDSEYSTEEGIETEDLSSGIESNEYGVSTGIFQAELSPEDENISLSGDELDNILETGELDVEEEIEEEFDEDNVKSFFDTEDDESIALSADELGNITGEQDSDIFEKEENFDLSESTEDLDIEPVSNLFEENAAEDEEIALSGDELNNLIESGEIESEEADTLGNTLFEQAEEDESIALSPDELGNITAEQHIDLEATETNQQEENFDISESSEELEIEESTPNLFEETPIEDEDIALSGDELNNLLESGEIESEEESTGSSFFEETNDEDDSITLLPDELGNITAEQEDEISEPEEPKMESTSSLFNEENEENEEIALSGDELNNILESGEIETEEASHDNPIDSGMVIGEDDFVLDDNSSLSSLGDFNLEDSTFEDTIDTSTEDGLDKLDTFNFGSVKKEELKKVISYMDELLGSLPDSYIKEFASSEYFELYKKIMNELEL